MLRIGGQLLRSRYKLVSGPILDEGISQAWLGLNEDDNKFLIKVWPFDAERPGDLQRALWDAELRTLYRVGSSPGADDTILVIRDAGVDKSSRCFAMVLEAPGYESLASVLKVRPRVPWLQTLEPQTRQALWSGLENLAEGIVLLHEQHILHRDVRAETVYLSSELGPTSFRLGGFEWSVRLGRPAAKVPPPGWSSPPEFFQHDSYGYRPETDWFGFGMLTTRLLMKVESYANNDPVQRHARILKEIERPATQLSDIERALLRRLIAVDPRDRLSRGYEVAAAVSDVIRALERGGELSADTRPLVVVVNTSTRDIIDRATELGFVPNPQHVHDSFNPHDVLHSANLATFIQKDLTSAQLYAVAGASFFILVGTELVLRLTQFEYTDPDTHGSVRSWDFAYCQGVTDLKWNEGGTASVSFPATGIVVRTKKQVVREKAIRQNAKSWARYLPTINRSVQLRASLARFHEFIRCTNQLELLIRDSEIFRYKVLNQQVSSGVERLTIKEEPRVRRPIRFAAVEGGMCEFLSREIESNKPDCRLVILTALSEDALTLPPDQVQKTDGWTVEQVDADSGQAQLKRVSTDRTLARAPHTGMIRTWGLFGQVALIRRRKRAIDRIEKHAYLLRSLSAPGQVYMDTGPAELMVPLSIGLVDEAKQAAIRDILRVRPIYALQGPPGTGKTTLVAHLLRQIFEDDPVSQVLITAQAHGAVDVLRTKVRDEAFRGVPEADQPLAVRLGLRSEKQSIEEGSVEEVSLRILRTAKAKLDGLSQRTMLQDEWLEIVRELERSLTTLERGSTAPDFCEVVKRGANITYCTTSAGDLEALADATQSFDWTIIEEAGKAHGFDLALPLQAGHRWLLIGDHKQLPPYRFKDYRDGIDSLGDVIASLEELPQRAGGLLDGEWLRSWRERSPAEQSDFKDYARRWLNTFERVFDYCSRATGGVKQTIDQADGAAAGVLSRQHRMHPTIGDLISTTYYQDQLVNRTAGNDGRGLPRVRHGLHGVSGLGEQAILWLDLPWVARDATTGEIGPAAGKPRYTNPSEIEAIVSFLKCLQGDRPPTHEATEFAVLSPYNQQVTAINRRLSVELVTQAGLVVKQGHQGRHRVEGTDMRSRVAHSVDSFQGNQAGVITVSLVRNNNFPPGHGLGFLEEASRINVLLSRAERLLVLVGSWEFFEHQLQGVSIDDPQLPLWHWKKVVTTLDGWFGNGKAIKIDAKALSGSVL